MTRKTKVFKSKKAGIITRFIDFHHELFQDERGTISIKPVVAYVCMWFLGIALIMNSVVDKSVRPSDVLINAVLMLGAMGLGADTADKFSMKRDSPTPPEVVP